MSEHLQSGYHPDADQISAFVEHALPAHAREQMLDHLAACEECRAVVAMSLPEVEEPEPVRLLHTDARKSWWSSWSGWTLTWSVAGALAAIALSVVIVRHAAIAPNIQAPNQTAVSRPPESPAPKSESPKSQSSIPSSTTSKRAAAAQPTTSGGASRPAQASVENQQEVGAAGKSSSFESLSIQGRNLDSLNLKTDRKVPESTVNRSLGVVSGIVAAPQGGPEARARNVVPAKPVVAAGAAAPPAPTTAAAPPIGQSAETVSVASDAARMETVPNTSTGADLSLNQVQITPYIPLKHLLPSGLPVLSIATQARRIVAIDTHNAVFLSKDEGKHWKEIQAPWPGHAVRASLIEFRGGNGAGFSHDKVVVAGALQADAPTSLEQANDALKKQEQPSAAAACCSLAGTVKDPSGAVIPGASVSVINTASHVLRTINTDSAGHYLFGGLAQGTYKVEAQAPGFMKQELAAVSVADSHPTAADLSLNIATESQTVTVETSSNEIALEAETSAKAKTLRQSVPVFEIVTDNGDHWTSADGITWKHM